MKVLAPVTFILVFLFYSCQKIVTLKLNTVPPQIVIQGEVTDSAGPYSITINQTADFYAPNVFPPVSGAVVKISDDLGASDSLIEYSPGIYSTQGLQARPGRTYTLSVFVQNKYYTSVSTMPMPVKLDSVTLELTSGFGMHRINAIVNFQDPPGIPNYYQFLEYINGQLFNKEIFILDDRLSDGKYISSTLRTDSSYLNSGDQLKVKMYSIDKNVYNYFLQLRQSSGTGAFNSTASPANPTSNITGGALGYFSAHTTQTQTITVY
ncbi:MAG TPA: DUF4249 domain-containing protein [Puia sp.]|jgi:hypothetical protein|nr:DUF4249 domain-containing protein [Puia sp.]